MMNIYSYCAFIQNYRMCFVFYDIFRLIFTIFIDDYKRKWYNLRSNN